VIRKKRIRNLLRVGWPDAMRTLAQKCGVYVLQPTRVGNLKQRLAFRKSEVVHEGENVLRYGRGLCAFFLTWPLACGMG
jgi:hypothetical protein